MISSDNGEWVLDRDAFERAFSKRTKVLITNTPHNPTGKPFLSVIPFLLSSFEISLTLISSGKMFSRSELEFMGEVCRRHDVTIVSDEVYGRSVFGGNKHVHIASLPG